MAKPKEAPLRNCVGTHIRQKYGIKQNAQTQNNQKYSIPINRIAAKFKLQPEDVDAIFYNKDNVNQQPGHITLPLNVAQNIENRGLDLERLAQALENSLNALNVRGPNGQGFLDWRTGGRFQGFFVPQANQVRQNQNIPMPTEPTKNQEIEEFLDRNENLSKYIKTSDNVEKITAREIYNKELTLSHETVHIWFSYKELSGFVETNKYQLGLFEDYYKNIKEVLFKVGDAEFLMPISTFWKSLKIDKKIKNKKSFEKAISIFGTCIGYTLWFPYLDSAPVYTGKTKISIDTFNEKNEEKELDRSQKESFKNICEVSYILPALKADEDIKDVIYELDDDIKEYFYEFEGLDDNGEDKVFIFKIGDNFYEVDIHCSANWVGDFSVRKNLPGDLSIVSIKEIKEYTIISSGDNYINLKY
jgi:hypothetical protein